MMILEWYAAPNSNLANVPAAGKIFLGFALCYAQLNLSYVMHDKSLYSMDSINVVLHLVGEFHVVAHGCCSSRHLWTCSRH